MDRAGYIRVRPVLGNPSEYEVYSARTGVWYGPYPSKAHALCAGRKGSWRT
jgi:hypothetical protein